MFTFLFKKNTAAGHHKKIWMYKFKILGNYFEKYTALNAVLQHYKKIPVAEENVTVTVLK